MGKIPLLTKACLLDTTIKAVSEYYNKFRRGSKNGL